MHRLLIVPALLLATACASDPANPRTGAPSGPACLDPNAVRTWHNLQGEVIYVDAGRHKYRIDLLENCREIGSSARMGFRGDPITGRVCGRYGDLVVLPNATCRISRVRLVDDATYADATGTPLPAGEGDDTDR